jgi:ribosome-associated toxin RatA of RatAB toxin-antitoxin module
LAEIILEARVQRFQRSALLPYPSSRLFELVNDIERYPEFLPWCSKAEILSRQGAEVLAALTGRKAGIEHAFTTRNVARYPEQIDIHLVDGPLFERLTGRWRFTELGGTTDEGRDESDAPVGCKVELDLQFEFNRHLLTGMLRSLVSGLANGLVDAFCVRAGQLYQAGGQA